MKSKRVTLDYEKGILTCSNLITDRMKRLREKHASCKEVEITQREDSLNVRSCSDVSGKSSDFETKPIFKTPHNMTKPHYEADYSSALQTKEETDEKDNPNKWRENERETSSSAKIQATKATKTKMVVKCGKETSHHYIPLNKVNNQVTLLDLKSLKEKKDELQDENFQKAEKPFSSYFTCEEEFPSQISFVNQTESLGLKPSCKSFLYSCTLGSSCHCSDCKYYCENEDASDDEEDLLRSVSKFHVSMQKEPNRAKAVKLTLRSPNDYKDFGLIVNTESIQSPSCQTHPLLPSRFKNDESYKMKLFKFLRKPHHSNNKTETLKFVQKRKFSQAFDGNLSKFYSKLDFKIRKVSSEKKMYESVHSFDDNRAVAFKKLPPQYFKFYSDKDIGFSSKWQNQLKESEMDDDVETDEEQLRAADRHISRELGDGIKSFVKNKNNVRNFSLLKF